MSMTKNKNLKLVAAVSGLLMLLAFGCSTDSPTAPTQVPIPPSGGTASASWQITVSLSPRELTVGTDQPTTVTIQVVRADNGQPPDSGTTIVIQTSLGDFLSEDSGVRSLALGTAGGFATILLFPGDVVGTAFVVAQLEASVGRAALPVVEQIIPVVADFDSTNSNDNLSVQFLNTSEGGPTKFLWDFGDGATSTDENPNHLYALPGDYPVTLTASKTGSSDSVSKIVTVNDDLVADFEETVDELTVVFRDTSQGEPSSWRWNFGDGQTSSEQNPTHTYRTAGSYVVTLTVRKAGRTSEISKTITLDPEELAAAFEVTIAGRTAQFVDTSSGNPTSWQWDFGDGGTSTQQHPSNTYSSGGVYVVRLEVFKGGESSVATEQITIDVDGELFISGLEPDFGNTGTVVTISGAGFNTLRRVFFDGVPADLNSHSNRRIVVVVPVPKLETVSDPCDDDEDGVQGFRYKDVFVTVTVELQSGQSDSLQNGFIYDYPDTTTCNED